MPSFHSSYCGFGQIPALRRSVWRSAAGVPTAGDDALANEEPLEIRVRGHSVAVTMRTPGHDKELAVGFLCSEGLLKHPRELLDVVPCQATDADSFGNVVNVFLAGGVDLNLDRLTRHVFASSSCGVCGKASIESVHLQFPPVTSSTRVSNRTLFTLPDKLRTCQAVFQQTGGLHAAGLFTSRGRLIVAREDVGRHNAVDKVLGHAFLAGALPLSSHILMVSGRVSFEIMQKALSAGIPIVAAVSAPTSLAVDFAQSSGQTLVGFLRGEAMNTYTHPERIRHR